MDKSTRTKIKESIGGVTLGNVSCNLSRDGLIRALQRCETRGVTLCVFLATFFATATKEGSQEN